MIDFDALPDSIPTNNVIPKGRYVGVVKNAEMKEKKDGSGEYLSLQWEIFDPTDTTKKIGTLFDIISESTSAYMMTKLKKFMQALDIDLGRRFELRDLTKVTIGKKCWVAISVGKDQNDQEKSQINIFDPEMFSKYTEPFMDTPTGEDVPFDIAPASAENY